MGCRTPKATPTTPTTNAIAGGDAHRATTATAYTNNLKQVVAAPAGGALFFPFSFGPDTSAYLTSYTYDSAGNTLSTRDPGANATIPTIPTVSPPPSPYTPGNLLATTTTPPGYGGWPRLTTNSYDAFGQRASEDTRQVGGADDGTVATAPPDRSPFASFITRTKLPCWLVRTPAVASTLILLTQPSVTTS